MSDTPLLSINNIEAIYGGAILAIARCYIECK